LFIDLDGWQGAAADGMTMDSGSGAMTTASRSYTRGSDTMEAIVVVGPTAAGPLAEIASGMHVETADSHLLQANIEGLKAIKSYDKNQNGGTIIVALSGDAMFSLSYNNIKEDDAVALAEKFDLGALAKAAQSQ
jgi:hypothetical protein